MGTRFITGRGQLEDSYALGKNIASEAKKKLGDLSPDIVLVFASSTHDYSKLLQGVTEITGTTPMIGCSTAGEFTEEGHSSGGAVCAFIKSDTYQFFTGLGTGLKEDVEAAIGQALAGLPLEEQEGYPYRSAIMLIDGLAGRGEEAVLTASLMLPGFDFAGGAAGDNLKMQRTHVFYNDKAFSDAVVVCLVHSKRPLSTAASHGHYPFTDVLTVTRAKEERVYEINGKNAWEAWKEATREKREELGYTDEMIEDPAHIGDFLLHIELGLMVDEQTYKLRVPLSKGDEGSLGFACSIPEGSKFRIMISDKAAQLSSVKRSAEFAKEHISGDIAGAINFDCVCRGVILKDEFYKSMRVFDTILGHAPFIGFETYGEICMKPGQFSGFHNTTSVVLILPD